MAGMEAIPRKSKQWRDRVEEYRQYADEAASPDGREAFAEIAQNCDYIAERLERLEERERSRGSNASG
jgi:hypothetical protein